MNGPKRGRRIGALALSAAFHLVLLVAVALHAPSLVIPPESSGPPEPIIPVLLTPRIPSAPAGRPAPIRLHRRPQRFAPPPPIAPLPVPTVQPARPAAAPGPVAMHPAPLPESPKSDLKTALRGSPVGCANPDAVGLTRAERAACLEQLGKGAKTAPFPGLGLAREKQTAFDAAAAAKEARRRDLEAPPPAGPEQAGASGPVWRQPPDPHVSPNPPPRLPP